MPRMLPQRQTAPNPLKVMAAERGRDLVPRVGAVVVVNRVAEPLSIADPLRQFRDAWQKERLARVDVDPEKRHHPPRESDTTLAPPWKTVDVLSSRLRLLCASQYDELPDHPSIWGIGPNRPAANSNPIDINERATWKIRQSRRPGEGRFVDVATGAYGERYSKYLFAIDHRGMHIVREMTTCDASSRGLPLHSLVCERAIVGGELFFDADDPGKVLMNFGSARFPVESTRQAVHVAEFLLALGYDTVVAMIPDREIGKGQYGFKDRYDAGLQNMVFRAAHERALVLTPL